MVRNETGGNLQEVESSLKDQVESINKLVEAIQQQSQALDHLAASNDALVLQLMEGDTPSIEETGLDLAGRPVKISQ